MPAMLIGPPALRQSLSHSYTHKYLLDPLLPGFYFTTGHYSYVSQNIHYLLLHCTLYFYSIAEKGVHASVIVPNYNFSLI